MKCICGYDGNNSHARICQPYKEEITRIKNSIQDYLIAYYLECYSISECCEYIKAKEKTSLGMFVIRKIVDDILLAANVKEGLNSDKLNMARQQKIQKTMVKRYGVKNAGQIPGNGWQKINTIPYKRLELNTELTEYKKKVAYKSRQFRERAIKNNTIPDECEYTGIMFADMQGDVNPNNPFKRTIDHKTPIIEAFFRGWSVDECSSSDNLIWCLRIINTLKGNTSAGSFDTLLPLIKEKLLNENKIC